MPSEKREKKPRRPKKNTTEPPPPTPPPYPPPSTNGHAGNGQVGPLAHWRTYDRVSSPEEEWILPGLIPRNRLVCVVGESGAGKSTLYAALMAAHTTGLRSAQLSLLNAERPASRALLYSPEGSTARETTGRLEVAGVDFSRAAPGDVDERGMRARPLQLPDRLSAVLEQWAESRVSLVVLDPIMSYLAPGLSPNDPAGVRSLLEALEDAAESRSITIIVTLHYRKSREGPPLTWIAGASAWAQVPRYIVAMGCDPEDNDRRVICAAKHSTSRVPASYLYRILDVRGFGLFQLGEQVALTAEDLGRTMNGQHERDALHDAKSFLKDALNTEERRARDLKKAANEMGISDGTLRRAKVALGVTSHHEGREPDRHMVWRKPTTWPA